jgi:hypothetical protein
VQNRSRRDIRSNDFDQGKPLRFDLGAKLSFASVDTTTTTIDYDSTLGNTETVITFGPALIGRGQTLRMTIITEGPPHISCPNPPLIGVTIKDHEPDIPLMFGTIFLIMTGISLTGSVTGLFPTEDSVLLSWRPLCWVLWA